MSKIIEATPTTQIDINLSTTTFSPEIINVFQKTVGLEQLFEYRPKPTESISHDDQEYYTFVTQKIMTAINDSTDILIKEHLFGMGVRLFLIGELNELQFLQIADTYLSGQ